MYHTNVQSDDPFHPVEDSGHLMGREVLQHGSTPDIQYIFSQSIAAEAAYLPNSSVPTALPSAGGELDLTSFGLDLGTVDLSAQPPAGLTGGNQRFPTELPSSFLDHFPTAAQGAPAAVPNPPSNPFESTLIGPREGNWGSTTELPSSFLDHFPAAVPNPPSNPFESTFVDPREGNWGSTTEMTTDFLDHFPAAAQAAPLAVVDLPAGPLASTFVGQQEVDDNLEQTPSQMDRDFVEFLKQQGYDPDHFQFETQEEPSPRPNRRSRQSKEKKYLKDHAAAAEWDESKNGKLTDQTCGSDRVVWWLCKEGHAWQTSIASRCKGKTPSVCTKCKPKRYVKDHEAASQWDESKNGELKDQTCASAKVVWWLCQEGHEWQTSIANRCRRKTPSTCLVCRPRGKRITRYIRNQSAASQWDESKNGELKDQTCGSEKVVWWVCKEGHEWQASIASRCRRKAPSRCPVCHPRGKRITRYIRNHAAASQWDESKNGELKDQTCGSSKVVWWLCKKGHEWQASILSRCRSEKLSVCPKCKPRRYVKDHAAASQWDESKNGELKDQACSSPKEVWWRCNQGHEWQASILSRCLREKPTACPE
ncbi:MAG: zinc-ribbon domain-containing protein, partial [Chlamydiae bacterium]|nr:zinc-ribbon domain-containing protein [Chlamydiota bacterium]